MDPYEKMMRGKIEKQNQIKKICFRIFMILLLVGCVISFFQLGRFRIEILMIGEPDVTIPFGSTYTDPGATAVLYGRFLPEEGVAVDVVCENEADTHSVGVTQLQYRARFFLWQERTCRTLHVVDEVKPEIVLKQMPGAYIRPGESYQEEGFFASDNADGDLTDRVEVIRYEDKIVYRVMDSSGNVTEAVRNLIIYDPVFPEITLLGPKEMELRLGESYREPGYGALDNLEGDLTDHVQISGIPDVDHSGIYNVTYRVQDSYGNETVAVRTVKVLSSNGQTMVQPEGKVIYLTFDDGPGMYTRQLLDVLKKYDVKATFFVVKSKYLDLLQDIVQEGHAVGIHSVTHNYRDIYASEEAYMADLLKMQEIIREYTGTTTTLLRFPGGSSNTVSKFNRGIMSRLTKLVSEKGFQYFDWNVNSGDAGDTTETACVVEYVINGVSQYDVAIVLQHDIKSYSVEAVEEIILWGLENGYRFLPLDSSSPNAHHKVRN